MKILVTGGTGLVGSALNDIVNKAVNLHEWIFVGSATCDLTQIESCTKLFMLHKPDFVIHLAGVCGNFTRHQTYKVELFRNNVIINENVLNVCHATNVQNAIFCSSYAAYDANISHVNSVELSDILFGPPRMTNLSYGFAKKMEVLQVDNYNKQYNRNYTCLLPVNLFGKKDNFKDGHFVPATIAQFMSNKQAVHVFGSSENTRYFLYADDLARYIFSLVQLNLSEPMRIICAPPEYNTIRSVVNTINDIVSYKGTISYDSNDVAPVQIVSNKTMIDIIPDFQFTSLCDALKETIIYLNNGVQ